MSDDFARLDATAQAALVRSRQALPRELVDAAIARIERLNPAVNAVITPLFEKAREAAARAPDGPFRGVPTLLKDLVAHSAGDPYHGGMRFLKQLAWTEAEDTYVVSKLRAAGFVFLGKTNTPELGPVPSTEPIAYGPTRNPWDRTRTAGGSSGGSAAAVASGMVPLAHGNDGGGSVRIPASACGLVGLKPTRGRTSLGPDLGEYWIGMAVEHGLCRSVRDTAALLDVLAGPMPGDPYFAAPPARPFRDEVGVPPGRLRVGYLDRTPGGQPVDPACRTAVQDAARLLESLGHQVEPSAPSIGDPELVHACITVVVTGIARDLDHWSARTGRAIGPEDVEPHNWSSAEMGRQVTATDLLAAMQTVHAWSRRAAAWWRDGFDLLLTPTLPIPPPPLGHFDAAPDDPTVTLQRSGEFVMFTMPFNASGQPAVSLPLHWSADGLPIGVQLVAAYGREDVLIRIAAQLEEARPWADRWPALHA